MVDESSTAILASPFQTERPLNSRIIFISYSAECLSSASDKGEGYTGWISKTQGGLDCQRWNDQTPHSHSE